MNSKYLYRIASNSNCSLDGTKTFALYMGINITRIIYVSFTIKKYLRSFYDCDVLLYMGASF